MKDRWWCVNAISPPTDVGWLGDCFLHFHLSWANVPCISVSPSLFQASGFTHRTSLWFYISLATYIAYYIPLSAPFWLQHHQPWVTISPTNFLTQYVVCPYTSTNVAWHPELLQYFVFLTFKSPSNFLFLRTNSDFSVSHKKNIPHSIFSLSTGANKLAEMARTCSLPKLNSLWSLQPPTRALVLSTNYVPLNSSKSRPSLLQTPCFPYLTSKSTG